MMVETPGSPSELSNRLSHPWVGYVGAFGVACLVVGLLEGVVVGNGTVAGFLGLYGIVALAVMALAYAGLALIEFASSYGQQRSQHL
ncbi:MAG: hypothetical protein ABEJ04_05600 [Halobacteriaceae archaeon]